MKQINNILVTLDLSRIDVPLIRYASVMAERLQVEKVYFVHNIKKYEISDLFEEQLRDVNLDEIIDQELNEKITRHFKADVEWEVLLSEDPYTESLIKYVVEKYQIQLTLVGNKRKGSGIGVVSNKLLRLLRCDILAVPEEAGGEIRTIWAGTDFSNDSRKIFSVTRLLQKHQDIQLYLAHVYNVPVQFSPYLNPEAMAPKVEQHVKQRFRKFIKKIDYPYRVESLIFLGRESAVAQMLASRIDSSDADLLVVADKGGNTFSPFAVGSVAEELFNSNLRVPLWVTK